MHSFSFLLILFLLMSNCFLNPSFPSSLLLSITFGSFSIQRLDSNQWKIVVILTSNYTFFLVSFLFRTMTITIIMNTGISMNNSTTLIIKGSNYNHVSGQYKCTASNSEGSGESNAINLTVLCKYTKLYCSTAYVSNAPLLFILCCSMFTINCLQSKLIKSIHFLSKIRSTTNRINIQRRWSQ